MKTQSSEANTQAFSSNYMSNMSSESKYGGLIEQSTIKKTRNRMFVLLSYMDGVVPEYYALHAIISVWRIIQFLGPSLVACYATFWVEGSLSFSTMSYTSVIYHFCPVEYRLQASVIYEFLYFGIVICILAVFILSANEYRKTAKLPKYLLYTISILNSTILFVIHPGAIQIVAESISAMIFAKEKLVYPMGLEAAGVVCALIAFAMYSWVLVNITSISLVFRPTSLSTVNSTPQVAFFFITILITFVTGFVRYTTLWPRVGVAAVIVVVYGLGAYIVFIPGGFISVGQRKSILASCMTGAVSLLLICIFGSIGTKGSEIQIFILIGAFIVSFIASHFILLAVTKKSLSRLDSYMDDKEFIETYSSSRKLIVDLVVGMEYAHPICIDWSLFKAGTERFPNDPSIWIVYGKFIAIYPEETSTLSYIVHNMISKKMKGNVVKQSIAQAVKIMTQRESSLSPELKRKMNKVSHQTQSSKRKLRHIWDLVIQGNVNEMESSINNAYESIQKSEADYNHLLSQYPNNRFVARAYSRFLKELLADEKGFNEWIEKIRQLERGIQVNVDKTTVHGIHCFPMLPKTIKNSQILKASRSIDESANPSEMDIEEEQIVTNSCQNLVVKERINNLRIPATSCTITTSLIIFFVIILIPCVAMLVYGSIFVDEQIEPLNFMNHLARLRAIVLQITAFSEHWVLERWKMSDGSNFFPPVVLSQEYPSLGPDPQTNKQAEYLISRAAVSNEKLADFRAFKTNEKTLEPTRNIVFQSTNSFNYFLNHTYSKPQLISFQSAVIDICVQSSKLVSEDNFTDAIKDDPRILNSVFNAYNMAQNANEALSALVKYVTENSYKIRSAIIIIEIVCCIAYALVICISSAVELYMISKNKKEVYRCLTSLPKNVVSQISESLRVLKKGSVDGTRSTECDTDMSKQEENILKIFATAGDSSSSVTGAGTIILIICAILIMGSSIGCVVTLCYLYSSSATIMMRNAPHIDYIFGSIGFMVGVFIDFNNGVAHLNNFGIDGNNINTSSLITSAFNQLPVYQEYYVKARFGGSTIDEPPFSGFAKALKDSESSFGKYKEGDVPANIRAILQMFKAEDQVFIFESLVGGICRSILSDNTYSISGQDELLNVLWAMISVSIYDKLFFPMFSIIVPSITELMKKDIPMTCIVVAVLLAFMFIIEMIIVSQVKLIEKKLFFALNLLLFCPAQVVLQTPKIVDVLSGDLSDKIKDTTNRTDEFYDDVVLNIPISVIIVNQQYQIITLNKASERIYGVEANSLLNTDIHSFFARSSFENADLSKFFEPNSPMPYKATYKIGENFNHLELNCVQVGQSYIITTRDVTQTVSYNTLIQEEKSKSDALLTTILPANLVTRVQAGEKNISFSVQSATILFLDIVEFTPWCASNTSAMVMSTLNRLFRNLDASLSQHGTMTKIKCIGDCYMCAGGIFSEVNQPAVHAREVTEFGLEAIQCLRDLDKELGLKLQIRVGINTGGPIVAGVLGTEKPTFEIIGPPINMAQQMEHHGVPMKVHISRSVYELIYGGVFTIKERGQIEVKNGTVVTYIVESKMGGSE